MAALDRYGGPEAWDAEVSEADARYAALTAGRACLDCGECTPAGEFAAAVGASEPFGWCGVWGEFKSRRDRPSDDGCRSFS